jgi:hypothetical protein
MTAESTPLPCAKCGASPRVRNRYECRACLGEKSTKKYERLEWGDSVIVVSTAFHPAPRLRQRCEESIRNQTIKPRHWYIDAGLERFPRACLENVHSAIRDLDPATIVLWVDGDDWLKHDHVIERVLYEYHRGAWMTWGQYEGWEGERRPTWKGLCRDSQDRRKCRQESWYASHLRTFRAGLFQQIDTRDLTFETHRWTPECCDLAVMWPMLEMADVRGRFISDVLYVYNYADRRARKHDISGPLCEAQARAVTHFRSLKPYARLERQPW